ncbi:hypothetical protein N4T77_11305 [Clostridium sp. CX1]|uniref:DZANK-type domain-containing protein n=1 Tax=Clostridium tanneri TaxID=3037988 RepID=A0ABU4JP54_9CLOT|nr:MULTISPECIES: hypothetical protein [unclassified Clostridium]MCT8977189.1 hypothetical protein [Clostridium sp. CX1]MDW8799933.1 hypothetical protein [Clostridium sp. A1-XYC3]
MGKICPVCNKINDIRSDCEECGGTMENLGRVQDFSDPYGPQQPLNDAEDYCAHLYKCNNCDNRKRIEVSKVNI